MSMDVKGFYPSVRPKLIFDTFRSLGFGGEPASDCGANPDRTHREAEPWNTALALAEVPPWP